MPAPTAPAATSLNDDDVAALDRLRGVYGRLRQELGRVIIGQEETIERLTVCLFARGHALLMGVPGLAKTLLVSKLAETVSLKFSRIQFTPDLMPMDITGTDILQETADGRREFHFVQGPVFANIVLADEINRAPPKTQAAMLEAMQEHKVTVVGKTSRLDPPFFVLATTTGEAPPTLSQVLDAAEIIEYQHLVRRVPVPDHIYRFAAQLVRKTRPRGETAPAWLKPLVSWGAGPRAVQNLVLGAKSRAALSGSYMARLEDVEAVAAPVLTHRLITTFAAQAEGIDAKQIVGRLVKETIDEQAG
jgi:MoxR-like ATPase